MKSKRLPSLVNRNKSNNNHFRMKVLVQSKKNEPTTPFSINGAICLEGFIQQGHSPQFFTVDEIPTLQFRKEEPVIGGVGTYQRVFERLGVKSERLSYPESLENFMGRKTGYVKVGHLTALLDSNENQLFIKPANDDKQFTGFICKHKEDRWNPRISAMENDALLAWSEVVTFITEFRVYVLNGRIQNVSRYRGPVDKYPDMKVVREMVDAYSDAPIAYGLDVGVTSSARTLLVEVNEALALSNYGLAPTLHAKMVASRWFEIMGDHSRMHNECDSVDSPPYLNRL
jgi:hypothetical protein